MFEKLWSYRAFSSPKLPLRSVVFVYCLPFTVYRLLFTVYRLLFTVYCLLFTVYRLPFTVYVFNNL